MGVGDMGRSGAWLWGAWLWGAWVWGPWLWGARVCVWGMGRSGTWVRGARVWGAWVWGHGCGGHGCVCVWGGGMKNGTHLDGQHDDEGHHGHNKHQGDLQPSHTTREKRGGNGGPSASNPCSAN